MKAFTQLISVATLIISVSLPVLAAPSVECTAGVDCVNSELSQDTIEDSLVPREESLVKSAKEFINFMKKNPDQVNEKSICFYTGGTKLAGQTTVTPTYTVLDKFANMKGVNCNIMQDLLRLVPASFADQGNWNTVPEWTEASRTTAKLVNKDPVFVLLGTTTKSDSIWETTEKPELLKSLRAGRIHDVQIWNWTPQNKFVKTGNLRA